MWASALSLHTADERGDCVGCPRNVLHRCAFEAPWGDGKTCIRRNVARSAIAFVAHFYPAVYAGYWPAGSPWLTPAIDVAKYAIVANAMEELKRKINTGERKHDGDG